MEKASEVSEALPFILNVRRMISATGSEGGVTEFFYNEQRNQSQIKSASTEIFQDFDNAGRITSQPVIGSSKLDLKNSYFANGQVNTYTEGSTTHTLVCLKIMILSRMNARYAIYWPN